jgi:S1-C subfamily serine protease
VNIWCSIRSSALACGVQQWVEWVAGSLSPNFVAAAVQLGVQGILVLDTRKGGPAAKAGIQGTSRDTNGRLMLGDIIVAFNRKPIRWAVPGCRCHAAQPNMFASQAATLS